MCVVPISIHKQHRIKDGNHIEVYECRSSSLTSLLYRPRRNRIKKILHSELKFNGIEELENISDVISTQLSMCSLALRCSLDDTSR